MATDIMRQPLGHTPLFTHSEVLLAMQDALMFCPMPCTMKIRCPMGGSLSSLGGGRLGEGKGEGEVEKSILQTQLLPILINANFLYTYKTLYFSFHF